jgi:hypothetical protein
VGQWWSIEVLHGEVSAFRWQEQHDSALIEAALTNGVRDGAWHADAWGVVFEVLFDTEEEWEAFRGLPVVRAALDAVPDPVNGLLIYPGRGGGAGAREPRRPKPAPTSGAVSTRAAASWDLQCGQRSCREIARRIDRRTVDGRVRLAEACDPARGWGPVWTVIGRTRAWGGYS